ncbi:MAG TPA: alpha/beta hydrolase-fold protein [Acidobacteriota bacterium]|nr:alpha/beta hydrolase-fold protein [Acidobacteriota bacterium]
MSERELSIRVRYPLTQGRLELRTDDDWDRSLQPDSYDEENHIFTFRVTTGRPYLYFKPVIALDGQMHWSHGKDYLILAGQEAPGEVYPHFFDHSGCSVCELQRYDAGEMSQGHSFRVFYPPGYQENTLARYPVIYMQDGQNLFFPNEAFGGTHWMVEETLSLLTAMNAISQVIVVGVYPNDRMHDYTQPGYEAYGRFLTEELKPFIDSRYRTLPGPRHTAVMGSSLGGVVSFFLAWNYPHVFGQAACLSSTFGYQDDLRQRVSREAPPRVRFYLDSGWPQDNFEVTRDMSVLLERRGYTTGRDLLYLAFPKAAHNESAWAMRCHIPFQFFFSEAAAG